MRLPTLALPALTALLLLGACEPAGTEVTDRTLEVGCGACQFGLTEHEGCYWAARIDGKVVPLSGDAVPQETMEESHQPTGMCSMMRQAVVSGRLYDSHLAVTKFDLLPPDPADIPDAPARTHAH